MRDILPEKISKSQNLPQKISKSQKGLQGNSSGGSQKNLKKSQKVRICLKKSQEVRICLKKSQKVTFLSKKISKSQSGYQLRYLFATQLLVICPGWVAVAVPFCNTAVNHMPRVGCSCGTFLQHSCQSYAICPGWVADAVPFCNATACQNLRMLSDLCFPEMSVVHCNLSSC